MLPNFNPFGLHRMPITEVAIQAEELGFDAVWVGDHLAFHPPILEATMALAAVSSVTQRIGLGFAVLLAPMRQPVWLAKSIQTLHHLAPGRVLAGFGVGGEHPAEWQAAAAPLAGRGQRLDELLELLPALLGGEAVEHAGELVVHTPPLEPAMSMPPILIGGRSNAALRRAARYGDAWMTVWMDPDEIVVRRALLADMAQEEGRRAPETTMVLFVAVGADDDECRRDAARLYHNQYRLPWEAVASRTACGSVRLVADQVGRYVDAGVTGFVMIPCRPDLGGQLDALAEVRAAVQW